MKIIVPKSMACVDVTFWKTQDGMMREWHRYPGLLLRKGEVVEGFSLHLKKGKIEIHLRSECPVSDLVHECVHAAQFLLKDSRKSGADGEYVAYAAGWLVVRVMRRRIKKETP